MKAILLQNGPYLHGLGWLKNDYSVVAASMSSSWQGEVNPINFDGSGSYQLCSQCITAEIPMSVVRSSGVARPRSAAKSTIYAALLGKGLLETLSHAPVSGERVGVAVACKSDTASISYAFESSGVRNGWSKTDTMLLPSSIPSAITTQTSAVFNAHAAALAFEDGAMGMCAALEYVYLSFAHQRSDAFLIIGADEFCTIQAQALDALEDKRPRAAGASGMILTRMPLAAAGNWQLVICAQACNGEAVEIPESWNGAARLSINIPNFLPIFTAQLIPLAVHQLLHEASDQALLFFNMQDICGQKIYVLGFQLAS
jgi:hypothetical protein